MRGALVVLLGGCELAFPLSEGPACPSADRPIGLWHLDEAPGSPLASDAIDELRPASYVGDVELGVPGTLGTAAAFHTDGHLLLGERFGFSGRAPFSASAWVRPDPDGGGFRHVVTKQQRVGIKVGWALFVDTAGRAALERYAIDNADLTSPAQEISTAMFTHVVGTYDGSFLRLYLNGLEVGAGTLDERDMLPANAPAVIGSATAGNGDSPFDGAIDEVAIYDRALDAAQILQQFEQGLDPACEGP